MVISYPQHIPEMLSALASAALPDAGSEQGSGCAGSGALSGGCTQQCRSGVVGPVSPVSPHEGSAVLLMLLLRWGRAAISAECAFALM